MDHRRRTKKLYGNRCRFPLRFIPKFLLLISDQINCFNPYSFQYNSSHLLSSFFLVKFFFFFFFYFVFSILFCCLNTTQRKKGKYQLRWFHIFTLSLSLFTSLRFSFFVPFNFVFSLLFSFNLRNKAKTRRKKELTNHSDTDILLFVAVPFACSILIGVLF